MTVRKKAFCICVGLIVICLGAAANAVNNGDVPVNTVASARRMIEDLNKTFADRYKDGRKFAEQLDVIEARLKSNANDTDSKAALDRLIRSASLANPLLDFDKLLVIRRTKEANRSLNSYTSDTIQRTGWDNEISELSNLRGPVKVRTIYRHPNESVMKHMDLHFSGDRIMFSGVGSNGRWAILEVDASGRNFRELTPSDQHDVQWFDSCYLPEDGYILTCSTASMQGLPCENGGKPMATLFRVNTENKHVRQLTFEQDSDWHPQIMHDGRVLYLRWEYTDTPHYFSRYLFHMNPDGTGQREYWGSGSYFPTAYCWARPIPGHPSMVVGIASGHHAKSETGRLILIDPVLGRKYPVRHKPLMKTWGKEKTEINIHPAVLPASETGCVQEIPGWGRDVVGNVYDNQGGGQKYTFGTPCPLSEKYFLVSLNIRQDNHDKNISKNAKWVLALVDVFDNMTVIYEDPNYGIFEPTRFVKRPTPPVLANRIIPDSPIVVFCSDVYNGPGMKGIPRGKVKNLRVFSYHYCFLNRGGHESCGLESGWDIKRILGTVPVAEDGSFCFEAPAKTPISIQPLDQDGAALAIMRSWMVGMSGETLSCNGCHEKQNTAAVNKMTAASRRAPSPIKPWYGPARPFGFKTEVQPVLDKYCIGCHNEQDKKAGISFAKDNPANWRKDQSYLNLVAFARHPGPESDLDMFNPMEWHASTSPLIQMLRKGHHGVKLDEEAWSRFYTWIDLNAPHRGMWNSPKQEQRRLELAKQYAGLTYNPEQEYRVMLASIEAKQIDPVKPVEKAKPDTDSLKAAGFPIDAVKARQLQGDNRTMHVRLPNRLKIDLVRIPAGQFLMGSLDGFADEAPRSILNIHQPFWMGVTEITNEQYEAFDPQHDTRYLDENGKDHAVPGYIANQAVQPVTRISWIEAMEFCKWLSKKIGRNVTLPTEAQWEWAARAGTDSRFFYGDIDTDFSTWANLADASRRRTFVTWDGGSMIHRRRGYPEHSLQTTASPTIGSSSIMSDSAIQTPGACMTLSETSPSGHAQPTSRIPTAPMAATIPMQQARKSPEAAHGTTDQKQQVAAFASPSNPTRRSTTLDFA